MKTTLTLTSSVADQLRHAASHSLETAGVLLASVVSNSENDVRLIGTEYFPVPENSYIRREVDSLGIASEGYIHALAKAEITNSVAIWFHTHPGIGSVPQPSFHDQIVDTQIADMFRLRANIGFYSALIISPTTDRFTFTGFLEDEKGSRRTIDQIVIIGNMFELVVSYDTSSELDSNLFDRNVRALGGNIQRALGKISVGVVGCGGTGSAVIEQLARLGVRNFTLIDPEKLSDSNTTRVYGSALTDIGRPKVDIAEDNIKRIAPHASCKKIENSIVNESIAKELVCCDFIFGCTDDNAGRLVLSRISTFLLIPVFDMGVLLSSNNADRLIGIDVRVTTLVPGQACLLCRDRIDTARAAAELMAPSEHIRLAEEGYAPALGRVEPAVVPFTTIVAATAVAELLERFISYGVESRPSELLLRLHDREISTNMATPRQGHYCDPSSGKIGVGLTKPFLGMTWAS